MRSCPRSSAIATKSSANSCIEYIAGSMGREDRPCPCNSTRTGRKRSRDALGVLAQDVDGEELARHNAAERLGIAIAAEQDERRIQGDRRDRVRGHRARPALDHRGHDGDAGREVSHDPAELVRIDGHRLRSTPSLTAEYTGPNMPSQTPGAPLGPGGATAL